MLFNQYVNKIHRTKVLQDYETFDGVKRVNETITLPEVYKLFKDSGFVPSHLTKDNLQ